MRNGATSMKRISAFLIALTLLFTCSCEEKERIPFDFDLSKYITLGEYKGIEYTPARTVPTDEEVWEEIIGTLDYCGLYAEEVYPDYLFENITEGEIFYGDIVKMDITLTVENEVYDDASCEGLATEIGGNFFTPNIKEETAEELDIDYDFLTQFLTKLENEAVGKQIGSEFSLSGTFPADNFDNDLINKDFVLTGKVTEVTTRYGHPEAIDEDVLEMVGEYDDFEDFKDYIVEKLEDGAYDTSDGEIWHRMCYEFYRCGLYNETLYEEYYEKGLKTGTVVFGDVLNIDFEGIIDGERHENACGKNYTLEIGSNSFIDGFESGLIGAEVGSTVVLNISFPENYHSTELQGKPVTFNVTINEIEYRYRHPDVLSDRIMKQLYDYGMSATKDFNEFFETVKKETEETLKTQAEKQMQTDVFEVIKKNSKLISIPKSEMNAYLEEYEEYYRQVAEYYGYESLEAYLATGNMTYDAFMEQGKKYAEQDLYQLMIVYQIARNEGFDKLSDEKYAELSKEYIEYYQVDDYAALCEFAGTYTVREWIYSDLVLDLVCDNAVKVE